MIEANNLIVGVADRIYENVTTSDTIYIHKNLMHYEINLDCKQASYLSTYDSTEPGLKFLGTYETQTMLVNSFYWKKDSNDMLSKYLSKSVYKQLAKCSQHCYGSHDSSLYDKVYTRNHMNNVRKSKIYDVTTTTIMSQYSDIIPTSTHSTETHFKHDKVYKKKKNYISTATTTTMSDSQIYYTTTETSAYTTNKYDMVYNKKKPRLMTTTTPYTSTMSYSSHKRPSKLYTTTTATYEPNTAVYTTTETSAYTTNKYDMVYNKKKPRLMTTTTPYASTTSYSSHKRPSKLYTITTATYEPNTAVYTTTEAPIYTTTKYDTVYNKKKPRLLIGAGDSVVV